MKLKPILFSRDNLNISQLNQLYDFYVNLWQATWKELNVNSLSMHDDFCRFENKLGLYIENQPVAFHGYGGFDLNLKAHQNHTYFKKLQAPVAQDLLNKKLFKIATTEYMCVDPLYRKISNHYLGEILGGFSAQLFRHIPCDAMITVARNDRSINKMCKMYGAYPLYENLSLNNVSVDIMVFEPKNIKDNPNPELQGIISELITQVLKPTGLKIAA